MVYFIVEGLLLAFLMLCLACLEFGKRGLLNEPQLSLLGSLMLFIFAIKLINPESQPGLCFLRAQFLQLSLLLYPLKLIQFSLPPYFLLMSFFLCLLNVSLVFLNNFQIVIDDVGAERKNLNLSIIIIVVG